MTSPRPSAAMAICRGSTPERRTETSDASLRRALRVCAAVVVMAVLGLLGSQGSVAAGGDLDLRFGAGQGYVTLSESYTANWGISGGLALADGSALIAGHAVSRFYVRRYGPDGALATDFGNAGTAEIPEFERLGGGGIARISIFATNDGGAVLAWDGLLRRITAQGQLDASYRPQALQLPYDSKIAPLPDGRVVAAFPRWPGGQVGLRFFLANGVRDTSRGDDQGDWLAPFPAGRNYGRPTLSASNDGKLLLAAAYSGVAGDGVALLRLDAQGAPDAGFGDGGVVLLARASPTRGLSLAIGADGRIAVATSHSEPSWAYRITALRGDGGVLNLSPTGTDLVVPLPSGPDSYQSFYDGEFAIVSPPPRLALASTLTWWQVDLGRPAAPPPVQVRSQPMECPSLMGTAFGGEILWRFCWVPGEGADGGAALALPVSTFAQAVATAVSAAFPATYFDRIEGLHLTQSSFITAVRARVGTYTSYSMLRYRDMGARDLSYQAPLGELNLGLTAPPQVLRSTHPNDARSVYLDQWQTPYFCAARVCTVAEISRLKFDGELDAGFGAEGRLALPKVGAPRGAYSAWQKPDGGLLVLSQYPGYQGGAGDNVVDLAAFLPTGLPDPAVPASRRYIGAFPTGERLGLSRVLGLPDGRVQGLLATGGDKASLRVLRWRADGQADDSVYPDAQPLPLPSALSAGVVIADLDAAVLPDGSTVVGVFLRDASYGHLPKQHRRILLRLNGAGRIDPSFGNAGMVIIDSGAFAGPEGDDNPYAIRVAIQADGKIILGHSLPKDGTIVIAVARFDAAGRPDLGFAAAGGHESLIAIAGAEVLADMLLLPDQGLLVSGTSKGRGLLLRLYGASAAPSLQPVVEFYHGALNHYFLATDPREIAAVDAGAAGPGWSRTGLGFNAYAGTIGTTGAWSGVPPACRFYGTPGIGPNSHFYTVDPSECEAVKRDPGWTYEGTAFYVFPPGNGPCGRGTVPIYRSYNQRFAQNDSNHRYTADAALYAQMQAQGWKGEGVVFCAVQ
ncbi:hypothetical protein BURK2_01248 [Burkholderiales bacterium]|nr:hypothetical protein BURK2_01248 [Burkholderiales bacterium]